MRSVDLIEKKKQGKALCDEEIRFLVDGFSNGTIPDYQISAWMMAIYFQGLTDHETAVLTKAMCDSGETLHLSEIEGKTVDKHSTGGVGDKTTLALAPLVASFGLKVAKMSGRGLGHTGGTLDKLESVAGFRSDLDEEAFHRAVNQSGVAICSQTKDLVPADKKLYALRDVTATVDQIGLIAASIMSKKLAVENDALVLDVKVGEGAFMKTREDAQELARQMVEIGARNGRRLSAVLSDMDQPLGAAVGNALEVAEAAATLKGEGPEDFTELVADLGGELLYLAKVAKTPEEGRDLARERLASGEAYPVFEAFLEAQGAEPKALESLPRTEETEDFLAPRAGYIARVDALEVGVAAMKLGAGRETKEDVIDPAVGLEVLVKRGAKVEAGQPLARIHHRDGRGLEEAKGHLQKAFRIEAEAPETRPLIFEVVRGGSSS